MVCNAHLGRALLVTLVLRLLVPHCCSAGVGGVGKSILAGEDVRSMLPEDWAQSQMLITMA